jgi:hypothetical protein
MAKYKQTIIPKVDNKLFKDMNLSQIKKFVRVFYNEKFKGKTYINKHKGISVKFTRKGIEHVLYARGRGKEKLQAATVLNKMIQNAEYTNFKDPDENDAKIVLGYLNFKVKVDIDNKIHLFRVVVRLTKHGKFFYDHAVKIKNRKS